MVAPKSYTGYDKDGNVVVTYTAVDANEYLNPEEVQDAIDNVGTVATEAMSGLSKSLKNIEQDAEEAIIVQGTKMTESIDAVASSLDSIASGITESLSDIYTQSVKAHDTLQNNANDDAYNAVQATANVVSIK